MSTLKHFILIFWFSPIWVQKYLDLFISLMQKLFHVLALCDKYFVPENNNNKSLFLKLEMENWNANFSLFWLIPFRHISLIKNRDKEFPLLKGNFYSFHAEIKFNSLWFLIKKTDLVYLINHWTTSKDLIKKCPLTRKQREGQLRGAVFARVRRCNHRGT